MVGMSTHSIQPTTHPVLMPSSALFFSLVSLTAGASFAKQLFPITGALGAAALRMSIAAVILAAVFRPWRYDTRRTGVLSCSTGAR